MCSSTYQHLLTNSIPDSVYPSILMNDSLSLYYWLHIHIHLHTHTMHTAHVLSTPSSMLELKLTAISRCGPTISVRQTYPITYDIPYMHYYICLVQNYIVTTHQHTAIGHTVHPPMPAPYLISVYCYCSKLTIMADHHPTHVNCGNTIAE